MRLVLGRRDCFTFQAVTSCLCGRSIPLVARRAFVATPRQAASDAKIKAQKLHEKADREQEAEVTARRKQEQRPWHRAGNEGDRPEEATPPSDADKRKGRLLTTPTRLLKLILPLPYHIDQQKVNESSGSSPKDSARDDIQPLALLVHPQQPLSYLERLLQAEIPPIRVDGNERLPNIHFRAEAEHEDDGSEKNQDGNVASYSGLGHEGPDTKDRDWVRWSSSTEVGDFIRDAARGREFAIDVEGYNEELRVAVPSFNDRTYYMRVRLRKMSRRIDRLAAIKQECDALAHRGAHQLALGGFGVMVGWWGIVYYVTFHTDYGWDLVEPVTYLAGLTTIMGGYLWFLYISRDLSYKAALNITVTRRRQALYAARGFDQAKWEATVHEANSLRREIKAVAQDYDVDWDEMGDLGGQKVKNVLEKERKKRSKTKEEEDEEEEEEEEQEKKNEEDKEPGASTKKDEEKVTSPGGDRDKK